MLTVRISKLGALTILRLHGRIVIGETGALVSAVQSQKDVGTLVLDLAQISTIDAAGLGELLRLRETTQSRGVGFKLINVMQRVSQILEITKLNSVFDIASEAEARPVDFPFARTSRAAIAACC
jgi:anti-anti-sigma factor